MPYAPSRIRTRSYHLIRALGAGGHDVTVGTLWRDAGERGLVDALAGWPGIRAVIAEPLPALRSAWNCVRALPGSEPLQARFSWSARLAARLGTAVAGGGFDVVHVEHLRGVRYGLALADGPGAATGRPALVWDAVDCISRLFRLTARESEARLARIAARFELGRTERCEGRAASRFDGVVVTSPRDREDLEALMRRQASPSDPGLHVDVLRNGLDLDYFSPAGDPRDPATIVVTGKMSYHANVTAVRWLLREVMPRVWAVRPDARVQVVGQDPPPDLAAESGGGSAAAGAGGPRVVVTGTVDDIRPYLRRATLAVAPIRYGVGIQNKVLEAFGCATPVVATPSAVAGLDPGPDAPALVAGDAEGFARATLALLDDAAARDRLGRAGRAFVERAHDWRASAAALTGLYDAAIARRHAAVHRHA
ncbi:MAG: glycosyltransferase [Vicinamibacterales bacterium]